MDNHYLLYKEKRIWLALYALFFCSFFYSSLFISYILPRVLAVFFFYLCAPTGLEPLTFRISLACQSLFYTTTLRGSVENWPWKIHLYFPWLSHIPKKLHYNFLSHLFNSSLYNKYKQNWPYCMFIKISRQVFMVYYISFKSVQNRLSRKKRSHGKPTKPEKN